MQKADLLDELRAEIGLMSDRYPTEFSIFYKFVCTSIFQSIREYVSVSLYIPEEGFFRREYHAGESVFPIILPFGDDLLTLAGMRGGLLWEKRKHYHFVAYPFYRGHHLAGVLLILTVEDHKLEEEEVLFLGELIHLFENKENMDLLDMDDEGELG
ncbi:hypothetical protein [Risungbinella massiliensis]|uniref:hypothetical protein n=1 Tax=Risungbinella massiliensis TaxID=1329796 RepID=UPI0005CC2D7D|nr:hypothetical protein [Risungbinella massiliensis]